MSDQGRGGGDHGKAAEVAPVSYSDYLELPRLLALQRPLAEPPVPDEMLFIVVHQTHELWFKQILLELRAVLGDIDAERWQAACRTLDRVSAIVALLVSHIDVLDSMMPEDFHRFRDVLGTASGMQSEQYRLIEELSGREPAPSDGLATSNGRSLRRAFSRALAPAARSPEAADALRSEAPAAESLARGLRRLYEDPGWQWQRDVAAGLLHFDEQMASWRLRHLQLVKRMIGQSMGTGGSMGATHLQAALERRFFPELQVAAASQGSASHPSFVPGFAQGPRKWSK
jgi:tryptophan 2,3-dioxygenase